MNLQVGLEILGFAARKYLRRYKFESQTFTDGVLIFNDDVWSYWEALWLQSLEFGGLGVRGSGLVFRVCGS